MKLKSIYDPLSFEKKWNKKWQDESVYEVDLEKAKRPFYNLMMFPYPSAEGLHAGNMYAFVGADVYGRYKRLRGYDVFEPMGLDGFGIHSENFAIKIGRHPKEHAQISEKNFYKQLSRIGNGFAWSHKLETYDPVYYKWTQWLFIELFKAGLAYKKKASVNWCLSCKTVLSDEQVEAGECERCKTKVIRKKLSSWHFKITKYADRLLANLDGLEWSKKIKIAQKNWIGKKEGTVIKFLMPDFRFVKFLEVFTTRPDTLGGVTFVIIGPELARIWMDKGWQANKQVSNYVREALDKTEQQRKTEKKHKTGVDTALKTVNPLNGESVPIWVADYVLADVGTGAVMGVPACDKRDREFAKKYGLEIKKVVQSQALKFLKLKKQVYYHLRDWLISRQRYWGAPIPMVNCKKCGWQAVGQQDLPVELPDLDDFEPEGTGKGPLAKLNDWKKTVCPQCGKSAERETDVCDTFLDSSWYYLGYLFIKNGKWDEKAKPFRSKILKKWFPVSAYIGGAEHAVLHLLYARFVSMVLKDLEYIEAEEPFPFLFSHGLLIKDGSKMSKSKGNVINPDEYLDRFGADVLRMYLMFLGPYDQGGDFRDTGMVGMYRFLEKIWKLSQKQVEKKTSGKLLRKLNWAIKKIGGDIESFKYNTAIAALMETVNVWKGKREVMGREDLVKFVKLLAPFAPFVSEEIYQSQRRSEKFESIHRSVWPDYSEGLLETKFVEMPVQVNGKLRALIAMSKEQAEEQNEVARLAFEDVRVKKWVENKKYRVVFVAGKMLNFVLI